MRLHRFLPLAFLALFFSTISFAADCQWQVQLRSPQVDPANFDVFLVDPRFRSRFDLGSDATCRVSEVFKKNASAGEPAQELVELSWRFAEPLTPGSEQGRLIFQPFASRVVARRFLTDAREPDIEAQRLYIDKQGPPVTESFYELTLTCE